MILDAIQGWWEFNGKKSKPPTHLVYTPKGKLDLRCKVNREFLVDKRWKYRNPVVEMAVRQTLDYLMSPTLFSVLKSKKVKTIKFRRYSNI